MYNGSFILARHGRGVSSSHLPQWVRKTLTAGGLVVNKRRPKHLFTLNDLTRFLFTRWTQDDLVFIHERYRLQFILIFRMYCWTEARLAAFFTGGLRYGVSRDNRLVMDDTLMSQGYRLGFATIWKGRIEAHLSAEAALDEEPPRS